MDRLESLQFARDNKYRVIENGDFYILCADPIPEGHGSFSGKDMIATNVPDKDIKIMEARMLDMKWDVANFYGKDSETYKKINWEPLKV
jgi:hypothetical protein